jgi:hypothetical protein
LICGNLPFGIRSDKSLPKKANYGSLKRNTLFPGTILNLMGTEVFQYEGVNQENNREESPGDSIQVEKFFHFYGSKSGKR